MMRPFVAVLVAAVLAVVPASAQDADPSDNAAVADCLEGTPANGTIPSVCVDAVSAPCLADAVTTADMLDCLARGIAVWDGHLNATYRELRRQLSRDRADALRGLQRIWIGWRDALCQYEADAYEGGSLAGVAYSTCYERETAMRAIALTAEADGR